MPGLTGLELVQQMRGEGMDTKVIFISGYAEFDYARKALKMGASDYLLKPVEEEDLKEILEELILELDGTKAYGEVGMFLLVLRKFFWRFRRIAVKILL